MSRRSEPRGTIVALLALTLGACVAPAPRPTSAPVPSVAQQPVVPTVAPITPPATGLPAAAPEASPWQRLRNRFAMADCDYSPQVLHWAERYTAGPQRFAASLDEALPFLLLVTAEIEERNLPGEFALLPYLESHYQPLRAKGNRPAGMWQIMPATARALGLPITPDYDARLDALASSAAALGLLARYHDEFGDWRLADMAYNAGEYRVKRLLGAREGKTLSATDLAHLKLSPTTHEHLYKLLALACIVEDPARFGVTLPAAGPDDALQTVDLEAGMDLRVVAHLAGMDFARLKRLNAGYRSERVTDPPLHLLLPANRVERFGLAAARAHRDPVHVVQSGDSLWTIARHHGVALNELREWNDAVPADGDLHPGERIRIAAPATN